MLNFSTISFRSRLMRRLGALALLAATVGTARAQAPLPLAPASARTSVPEASGYGILYQLDVPTAANFNTTGITYTTNNSAQALATPARVAYYLELTNSATNATTYVWTSMANFATTLTQLGIPNPSSNNVSWHQNVTSLNVFSNVAGVTTGTNLGTGRIEMWPMNYIPNNVDGVPGASNTTFDFGDQMSNGNYGSFQVHNVSAGQTVLAYNNWGSNGGNGDIGIGNQPQAGNSNPDWTFANNAGNYSVKRLTILATATPTLTSLSPTGGPVGTSVTLTGTNLAGTTAVSFNGTAATAFTVVSATSVTASVPAGTTTGLVTVTTPGGVSNGLTFVAGLPTNNALAFNGTNNSVPIARPIQDDFTIEYWVKTTQVSLTGSQWYLGNGMVDGEVGGVTNDFGTALLNGKASFGTGSPDVTIVSSTTINNGSWHHIAATRTRSTGLMQLYVDGRLEASSAGTTTSTSSLTAPPRLLLGGTQSGASFFAGQLDEVRIYSTALSAAQIQADMFSTTSAVAASQVSYYNFDQGSAGNTNTGITSLPDLSGNGNTGTLQNFALTGTTSNWVRSFPTITGISPASGPVGTSVTVTGTNLLDANSFRFNSTAVAPFTTPTNDLTATVAVPSGATTGAVSVASATLTAYNGPVFTVMTCPLPTAIAQSSTVALAANGAGTLAATAVNNGSTPTNCGNLTYQVQKVVYGQVNEGQTLTLTAPAGAVFTAITFASYGTPTGSNGNYSLGGCNGSNSMSVVAGYLLGKNTGSIHATNGVFTDPCNGTFKSLAVQAVYTTLAPQVSYTCADVAGPNYVLLTVTDAANNTSTTTASVSVTAPASATITSLSPTSGAVGQTITVTGTNLGTATGLVVNGTAATISNNTGSSLTFVVPSGATALGNVVVSTSCVPASAAFTVVGGDLTVSTTMTIPAGTYNSITVTSTGNGTLAGNVVVNTAVTVQSGGTLSDGCFVLTGAGTFTLAAGGTLGICSAQGITPSGATGMVQLTGARSFSTDANYVYTGTAAQVTGAALPAQVRNLSTTNANDLTLTASTAVVQVLTIGAAGNLVLNNQALTLIATPTTAALLVNSGTGTVNGNTAVVQTYLDPSVNAGPGYRHLSTPVSGATVATLTTASFTPNVSQSSTYNASATPGTVTPFPTVFGYDQSRLASVTNNLSAFEKGFAVPAGSSSTLNSGFGYAVNLGAGQVVSFTGQPLNGTITNGIFRNMASSANAADAGWNLMGNPYPAPYDYSQVAAADRSNLDAAMYVFASTSQYGGNYRSYVNGVGGNPVLALGQGFFVRVSSGQTSGSYTFRNAQRLTTPTATTLQRGTADARPLVQLDLLGSTGPTDTFFAYAEAGATPDFDAQFDAVKRANTTGLNLASLANGAAEGLAIDARPAFTAATVLSLRVGVPAAGAYTLSAALHNLPAGLSAYLRDAATGQTLNLSQQPRYAFDVSTAQAAGLSNRFSLSFSPQAALAAHAALSADEVTLFPNPAHAGFTVLVPAVAGTTQLRAELLNTLGQVVRQVAAALPADGARLSVDAAGLAVGVYTLRLHAGPTTLVKRVVLQ